VSRIKNNILIFIAAILIFAAAIYLWGAVGLDPQGLEILLKSHNLPDIWPALKPYFFAGLISIILSPGVLFLIRIDKFVSTAKLSLFIPTAFFCLTFFPPQWIMTGFAGILVSVLAIVQNLAGIIGAGFIANVLANILEKYEFPKIKRRVPQLWGVSWIAGILYAAAVYFIGQETLGGIPHIGDELVQLWGAKALAAGHFTLPIPPLIEFFFEPFLIADKGRWFTQYPAGFQMMLVPFVWLNAAQLLNPILAGLTLLLFLKILKELNLSLWWGLLFALSPFVFFMSAALMNHSASMFWGALGVYAFLKSGRAKSGWMFLWGLSAGWMFSIRPYTAVCFHLPLLIIALRKKIGWGIFAAALAAILGSLPYFINNYYTTGSLFVSGYQAAWDGRTGLFFSESPWGPQHTPQYGIIHLFTLLQGLNSRLLEIPIPALIGVVCWLLFKTNKWWKEQALFWAGISVVIGYYFYFYVDLTYGPRFVYCSVFPLLAVSALGIEALGKRLRNLGWSRSRLNWFFAVIVILLLASSALISLPSRIKDFSQRYQDVDKEFICFVRKLNLHNAVVLLDDYPSSDRHARLYSLGFSNRQAWYYSWMLSDEAVKCALKSIEVSPDSAYGRIKPLSDIGAALNKYWGKPEYFPNPAEDQLKPHIPVEQGWTLMSPFIEENDVIFARDLGAHNSALKKRFPRRDFYRIDLIGGRYSLSKIYY